VQDRAIGDWPMVGRRRWRAVEPGLQRLVAERLDLRPVQPGGAGPALDAGDGPQAGLELLGHLPVAAPQGPLRGLSESGDRLKEANAPKNLGQDLDFVIDRNDNKTYTPL
jgi:hypothetical protein